MIWRARTQQIPDKMGKNRTPFKLQLRFLHTIFLCNVLRCSINNSDVNWCKKTDSEQLELYAALEKPILLTATCRLIFILLAIKRHCVVRTWPENDVCLHCSVSNSFCTSDIARDTYRFFHVSLLLLRNIVFIAWTHLNVEIDF